MVIKLAKSDILTRLKQLEEEKEHMELLKLIPELQSRIQFLETIIEDRVGVYIPKRTT